MKKIPYITKICLPLALLCLTVTAAYAHHENREPWQYTDVQLQRSTDGKELLISYTIHPQALASQELLILQPVLMAEDGQTELYRIDATRVYAGSRRYQVLSRRHELGNSNMLREENLSFGDVLRLSKSDNTEAVHVTHRLPFAKEYAKASLMMEERWYGCAGCRLHLNQVPMGAADIRLFGPEDYVYDFREPAAVAVKSYAEAFDSKVNFEVARHELKVNYKNNAEELARLDSFISKALSLKGADLKNVDVSGHASPEGGFEYNKALSERRANSLLLYVKSKYPQLGRVPSLVVKGEGEDWQGLRQAIADSQMEQKDELLAAIDQNSTDVAREAEIKKMQGGSLYKYLLANLYPPLRRTTFSMSYEVRPYKVEELPEIYQMNPALMSHQELFLLAQQLEAQQQSPLPVYKTAYERFRDDPLAAVNYGNALLKYQKDAAEAIRILLPWAEKDKRALFPLAIAYHMQGDTEAAMKYLHRGNTEGCKRSAAVCDRGL